MKRYIAIIFILLLSFAAAACRGEAKSGENGSTAAQTETPSIDNGPETEKEPEPNEMKEVKAEEMAEAEKMEEEAAGMNKMYIEIGQSTLTVNLEDNESTAALKELLADGALTISASNYGGFEKVCSLGTELPRDDNQTTTHAGDVCLYNGSQIVIFYGSNSWAYTKLGKISDADQSELEKVLSGEETEITLSIESESGK